MSASSRLTILRWCIWCAAALVIGWQLFVPPIVGLSDQGDFQRVIGRFGYARADRATTLSDAYVARKYVYDPSARAPGAEQPGPEYVFTGAAVLLNNVLNNVSNKIASRDGLLDIRMMGFVHAAAFLFALMMLLRAANSLTSWILAVIALTDVGYVAYWNSFYSEPASCIFFLLLLAESIGLWRKPSISTWQVARWCLWAALLVAAKPQNFLLAIVLIPFALRLALKTSRFAGIAGAVAIAIATIATARSFPIGYQWGSTYNQIFLAILPDSKTPAADLQSLGIDPRYASYSGTGAWSEHTAFGELVANGSLQQIRLLDITEYYVRNPAHLWRRLKSLARVGYSLRPEWCGNYERSAGYPPGARSNSFALWSTFHERILGRFGSLILISLAAFPIAAIFLWARLPSRRLQIELSALLAISALFSFAVAAFGDAWDNVKHCFLFNLQLDACLIMTVSLIRIRTRPALIVLGGCLLLASCKRDPWYSVPEQRPSFEGYPSHVARVVDMGDPDADLRIVRDINPKTDQPWRWTGQRPAVKIRVRANRDLKYTIDFTLPDVTFKATGPVTMTFTVNDHVLERVRYTVPGYHQFEKAVPAEWLPLDEVATVGAEIDKLWTSEDGKPFGFILSRIGLKQ